MNDDTNSNLKIIQNDFINYLKNKGRASATVLAYGKDVQQLIDFLTKKGINNINEVTQEHLHEFLDSLASNGYTKKSVSRKINSIKTLYRFFEIENRLSHNPASAIKHPKIDLKEPRVLSKMEYRALRDACRDDKRIYAIAELFLQAGIRVGELINIKIDDVKEGELAIRKSDNTIDRKIPLNKSAEEAIKNYLKIRPQSSSDVLFVTKTGRPFLIRNIRTAIERYFKEAGIKNATVNDLRKTFIAHQLSSSAPLKYISEIVGHKRISTTEKYLDLIEKIENKSKDPKLEEL